MSTWIQNPYSGSGGGGTTVYAGVFGDGSDGAVTLDGVTTYNSFSSLAGSIYTLTRPVFASSLTVNSGITLDNNSYAILCTGAVSVTGTIRRVGQNASGATGGNGAGAADFIKGGDGGNGATGAGNAASGAFGHNIGGNGGNGGASGGNAGGAGGSASNPNHQVRYPQSLLLGFVSATSDFQFSPGFGAGGGGGDGTNSGGGGGGGGGLIGIWAKTLTVNAAGVITAVGGNGANGVGGNAGGGGGGGGGVIAVYTSAAYTNNGSITVAGGALGNGVGTGANGTAGTAGLLRNIVIQ